ncbi:hypothetical protein MNBD_NITROSPINAE04-1826 [hydrothermal vent metagenome]|uniref:Uncharacterized protein n=1 Tax=hydrothermal vent metagenome TaxID=652676 RepID=A0A3B1CZI0_9ZZZZ
MSAGGWFMITVSWAFIIGLSVFCMRRVLKLRDTEAEHIKPIYEIDTGDLNNSDKDDSE